METISAIYAGSFDPIHNGHLDIIYKASRMFHKLTVLVCSNPNKKHSKSEKERVKAIQEAIKHEKNVDIAVLEKNVLLADYAHNNGYSYLVRSFRNGSEADAELQMAWANEYLSIDSIETVFIMPNKKYLHLSSSLIREAERCK